MIHYYNYVVGLQIDVICMCITYVAIRHVRNYSTRLQSVISVGQSDHQSAEPDFGGGGDLPQLQKCTSCFDLCALISYKLAA